MPDPSDDSDDDTGPDDDEIREALQRLRGTDDDEPSLDDVITLWNAAPHRAVPMLPEPALAAIAAMLETRRDVANGGVDQVVWNHGVELARAYAGAWNAVGMIENAALLVRLADSLEAYTAEHGSDAMQADVVQHFIAWRKSVGGPAFGIPDPQAEMGEPLLEYVIAHRSELPDPGAELPRRPVADAQ